MIGHFFFVFLLLFSAFVISSGEQLSDVNACLKSAKTVPGNSLNGRTLGGIVGFGWDDLQSTITKPVFHEEFTTCQAEPTGTFLLPDNVVATPILQTSLDRMANYYETFSDYKKTIKDSFTASAGGGYGMFSASASFSKKHQESKENFAKYKSSMLHTKLIYKSFNLYREPNSALSPSFTDRIEQITHALSRNLTNQARYIAEMVIKDFGTHYISTADTGAIIEQEMYIDSSYAFTDTTTLDSVRAAAGASFGSYFHASAEGTHEVTTENKQALSNITKHSKILTSGGPDVNEILSSTGNGSLKLDNLVSFNHDGDWLYQIVVPRNFPKINYTLLFPAQQFLKNATEMYYRKNTIRGCTDMSAPNYNFQANFDDGTCKSNNDTYPFGGVYQICSPLDESPQWRCDSFKQDNLFVGGPVCDESIFEAVKLLEEVYGFEDRIVKRTREVCHHNWYGKKKCRDVDYDVVYKDTVKVTAFWCRKKADVELTAEQGAMFGGLYEEGKPNEFTGEIGCPGSFQPYRLGRVITVCISYEYETDHPYSVPIKKLFSCQTPTNDKVCSTNFTQHLAAVENNCDVFFCVRRQTYKQHQHPALKRPPFTSEELASSNYHVHTINAFYKGVKLFSTPLSAVYDEGFLLLKKMNPSAVFNVSSYIDRVHAKVMVFSNNLTASAEETLEKIHEMDPDD